MIDKLAKQILPGILSAIFAVALTETVYTKNLGDSGPDSPITISGILSLDRKDPGYVLITSNDTVAGYPVRRIGINPFEDISRGVRYDELKKLAASGKQQRSEAGLCMFMAGPPRAWQFH